MFGKLEAVWQGWGAEGGCGREVGDGAGESGRAPLQPTEQTVLQSKLPRSWGSSLDL